ncbi:hypothetical protein [Silvanigrella sp.]|uniref:phage major capsid protein n=1 Tax=Silvanigrella sp. TaxID=2024976 RepID=UPI0037CC9441
MTIIKRNSAIRSISFEVHNKDAENRTIEVIASTGAKVLRYRWFEDPVYEEIEITKDSIDFSRFGSGCAPLLKDHYYELNSQIGVIENSWVEEGKLKAKIRFSKRDDVEPIYQDILDGILRNVSIGYRVLDYKKYKNEGEKYETVRATKILPLELSFVTVPADPDAGVRALDDDYIPQIIIENRRLLMLTDNQTATTTQTIASPEPVNQVRANANSEPVSAIKKELSANDCSEINRICSESFLDFTRANEIIKSVTSLDEAKVRISEIVLKDFKEKNTQMRHAPVTSTGHDESQFTRSGIESALTYRMLGDKDKIDDNSKRFLNLSMVEIARRLVRNGDLYNPVDLFQRAITSTDLPLILSNIADKTLRDRYKIVSKTYEKIVRKVEVSDLNIKTELQTGSFGELADLGELEAYNEVTFGESAETYKTSKHGNSFSFSEEMFLNDRLNVLPRAFQMFADSTAKKISTLVYNNLTKNNTNLSDGLPIFHEKRGNIAVETKDKIFSDDVITEALVALTRLKDADNNLIEIPEYKYVYTTKTNEPIVRRVLASIPAVKSQDLNIYAGRFEVIVENRLEELGKNAAIFISSPEDIDGLILSYLKGYEEPKITRIDDPKINAVTFTCKMFAASKAIDTKGFYLHNPKLAKT